MMGLFIYCNLVASEYFNFKFHFAQTQPAAFLSLFIAYIIPSFIFSSCTLSLHNFIRSPYRVEHGHFTTFEPLNIHANCHDVYITKANGFRAILLASTRYQPKPRKRPHRAKVHMSTDTSAHWLEWNMDKVAIKLPHGICESIVDLIESDSSQFATERTRVKLQIQLKSTSYWSQWKTALCKFPPFRLERIFSCCVD